MDQNTVALYVTAGIMVILAALGSYMGSVRSVGKIETRMAEQHGENKTSIAGIKSDVVGLDRRLVRIEGKIDAGAK